MLFKFAFIQEDVAKRMDMMSNLLSANSNSVNRLELILLLLGLLRLLLNQMLHLGMYVLKVWQLLSQTVVKLNACDFLCKNQLM